MDLFPHSSPDRSWSWIKDDFRTVPRVHLGLPEGTIGDYTLVWKGADPLTRARLAVLICAVFRNRPPGMLRGHLDANADSQDSLESSNSAKAALRFSAMSDAIRSGSPKSEAEVIASLIASTVMLQPLWLKEQK